MCLANCFEILEYLHESSCFVFSHIQGAIYDMMSSVYLSLQIVLQPSEMLVGE